MDKQLSVGFKVLLPIRHRPYIVKTRRTVKPGLRSTIAATLVGCSFRDKGT